MRRTVQRLAGCLGRLSVGQRAVLERRAGVGPLRPRSRYVVARRLEIGPMRVARLERSGMRRLRAFSRTGGCATAETAVAPGQAPSFPGGPQSSRAADGAAVSAAGTHDASTRAAVGEASEERSGVKGDFQSSDDGKPATITPPAEPDGGADLMFPILLLIGAFLFGYAVTRELSSSGRTT